MIRQLKYNTTKYLTRKESVMQELKNKIRQNTCRKQQDDRYETLSDTLVVY